MKRKVYTDGNGSSLIMVEGLGEYVPKSEFVKIKAELEQHDDQITNIEIVNQEMLAVADARINKLNDAAQKLNSCAAKNMYGETVVNTKHFIELITLSNELKEQNNG